MTTNYSSGPLLLYDSINNVRLLPLKRLQWGVLCAAAPLVLHD
jgi:hypothetical protein